MVPPLRAPFPHSASRRMAAIVAERAAVEISPFGLHWAGLDEDVSVAGLLAGRGGRTGTGTEAA